MSVIDWFYTTLTAEGCATCSSSNVLLTSGSSEFILKNNDPDPFNARITRRLPFSWGRNSSQTAILTARCDFPGSLQISLKSLLALRKSHENGLTYYTDVTHRTGEHFGRLKLLKYHSFSPSTTDVACNISIANHSSLTL